MHSDYTDASLPDGRSRYPAVSGACVGGSKAEAAEAYEPLEHRSYEELEACGGLRK